MKDVAAVVIVAALWLATIAWVSAVLWLVNLARKDHADASS